MKPKLQAWLQKQIKNYLIKRFSLTTEVAYVEADRLEAYELLRAWRSGEHHDPAVALRDAVTLRTAAEQLVEARVLAVRAAGQPWRVVADALGVSHQAAMKKYKQAGQLPLDG